MFKLKEYFTTFMFKRSYTRHTIYMTTNNPERVSYDSMREYMMILEERGLLRRVTAAVDLDYEMPATKGRVLEALKYERPGYGHWVRGNGHKVITFDPIGQSKTVAEGELVRRVLAFE